mmetsp:Transcript_51970/g.86425  ORF Transcript_51970/g.86425 Transcript_51970/m.86425 type:complete len:704 (+) Transcript_51970:55-2166(+)
MLPAFQLYLNNPIQHGLATVGKFDGQYPSLAAATSAGKIFIHSPHTRDENSAHEVRFLNINRRVTALTSGTLNPTLKRELLLVGTQTNLLAYDVEENSDIFYKDVPDGVNAMVFGRIGSVESPLAVVGGNCSIQGFDFEGNELFWTVTGDNVCSLCFVDVDEDGQNELLVGSDDFEMRIFQNEEVIAEIAETDRVILLAKIRGTRYGYGLANGTIGIYDKTNRVWRVKSKNNVTCLSGFDLDADGVPELISGWSNGKIEVRNDRTGEVIFKDHFTTPVSAIVQADYRLDGRTEVICCSADGQVRGYLPADNETTGGILDTTIEEDTLRELNQRKQELLFELKNYEDTLAKSKGVPQEQGVIPHSTRAVCTLEMNVSKKCVDLVVQTNNDTIIKSIIVFAEQLFSGESLFVHPKNPSNTLRVPISPPKDVTADMLVKIVVGTRASNVFHVFEVAQRLPKFAMYMPVDPDRVQEPISSVTFHINERINRVIMWINNSFNIEYRNLNQDTLYAAFVSVRTGKPLCLRMTPEAGGTLQIRTDDMEVAGEVIQDMCGFLTVAELECTAEFPHEMESLRNVLLKVDEYNAVRLRLTADAADTANLVKTLVIRAEDSRMLGDMILMRKIYQQLYDLNRDLISEHTKRANNHNELLASLKEVNQMIQKAARLRVGNAKARVVSACRNSIKSNNIHALFSIIRSGADAAAEV